MRSAEMVGGCHSIGKVVRHARCDSLLCLRSSSESLIGDLDCDLILIGILSPRPRSCIPHTRVILTMARTRFIPLDSQITLRMFIPMVSIGLSDESPLSISPHSIAALSCQSTRAHVLPGYRQKLTLLLSIRHPQRLGDAISPLMHGGTLQPGWSVKVNVPQEVQLIFESLRVLVGLHLPAFSAGSSFNGILRDTVRFLDQAGVMKGGDPLLLRLLLRWKIFVPGESHRL